jgi:very-short-patch-repair endonuclease
MVVGINGVEPLDPTLSGGKDASMVVGTNGVEPLDPTLSGGKDASMVVGTNGVEPLDPTLSGGKDAPPLTRGGREGLGFLPYNKNLTALARENRKNPTPAEHKIWNNVLRMRQFAQYKFLRQKPIANYIVDFYCVELRLVIEIDGDSHAEAVSHDAERTRILSGCGLTVIRYANADVFANLEGVHDDLSRRIRELIDGGKHAT